MFGANEDQMQNGKSLRGISIQNIQQSCKSCFVEEEKISVGSDTLNLVKFVIFVFFVDHSGIGAIIHTLSRGCVVSRMLDNLGRP